MVYIHIVGWCTVHTTSNRVVQLPGAVAACRTHTNWTDLAIPGTAQTDFLLILFSRVLTGTLCSNITLTASTEETELQRLFHVALEPLNHVVSSSDTRQFSGVAGCILKCVWLFVRSHRYWESTKPGGVPRVHIAVISRGPLQQHTCITGWLVHLT